VNTSLLSRNFILGFMAVAMLAMVTVVSLHLFAVATKDTREAKTPAMMPAPAASGDADNVSDVSLDEMQMAEVSDLMGKLKENPNDSATLVALGDVFLKAGDWIRAEFFLARAVLSKPADIKPRYMLGIAQYQQNKIPQTVKTFEELLGVKEDVSTMYNLGVIYKYQIKDDKRAAELFNQVLAAPDVPADVAAKAKSELE